MTNHEHPVGALGCPNNPLAVGGGERQRLFTKDVLAGFQCPHGHIGVQRWRESDVDEVDLGIVEQLVEFPVGLDARKVDLFPRWAKVTLNSPPITGSFLGALRTNGGHANARYLLVRQPVGPAHKSDTYKAHVDHDGESSVGVPVFSELSPRS